MSMTPEIKFRRLELRAMTRLSYPLEGPEKIDLLRASVVVRIWRYPAFEPYQSWYLIKGIKAKEEYWLVRRTTWDRTMDYQRAHDPLQQAAFMIDPDPAPAVEVVDTPVHEYFVSTFMERLGEVTVPSLIAPAVIGLDGVAKARIMYIESKSEGLVGPTR